MNHLMTRLHQGRKLSVFTAALGAVALFCCIMLTACGGSSSPESVAEKAGQAYVDQDASAYYNLLAKGYADYVVGPHGWYKSEEEFEEDVIGENMEDLHDKFKSRCGSDYTVTVSAKTTETCDDEATLKKVRSELVSNYEYESEAIQDAAEVEIKYRVVGGGTGGDYTQTLNCVKVGGGWYIHQPEIDAL